MNGQLASSLHTPENTVLLTETIRKVVEEVGAEVAETPRELAAQHYDKSNKFSALMTVQKYLLGLSNRYIDFIGS